MNKKYCYREPNFPESAYLGVTFIKDEDVKFIYPMMGLYSSLKKLQFKAKRLKRDLTNKKKDPLEIYGVIAIKINFNKKFPLKKEYWVSPENSSLNKNFRMKEYLKMLEDVCQFYNIMVLPDHYDTKTKKWHFINWIPVSITTDDKKFDELSRTSDQPVDPSAKNIGIYSIEFVKGFDLEDCELIEPDNKTPLKEVNC